MLCDDSATVRAAMRRLLEGDPGVRVVAQAADGRQALAAAAEARPDVVLLDLEMPVMDGMTALPLLLRGASPPAVIVASSLTQRGAAAAMAALRAGAADYVPKPGAAGPSGLQDGRFQAELLAKVKGWAGIARRRPAMPPAPIPSRTPPGPAAREAATGRVPQVLAIGSSTGGPQALAALIGGLRGAAPVRLGVPVLVVQHMPPGFTAMLADHVNRLGVLPCAEAVQGEPLRPDRIYIAPGERHLTAVGGPGGLAVRLSEGPPENFCRPAVDPMLRSLAAACGSRVLAVILTGMGQDGLAGCRAVVAAGGEVMAQDEASSVVWGMPGAVARAGLARHVLPPPALAGQVLIALAQAPAARWRPAAAAVRA
nr:chemotaxis-specific protein-glutamate methyltransferase CheB [Roseomonas acroporae]